MAETFHRECVRVRADGGDEATRSRKVHFTHLPAAGIGEGDHETTGRVEERYREWRMPHLLDRVQVHGHTHRADQFVHSGNHIHVGVDAHGLKPVSIHRVEHEISEMELAG
jgi:calcineurin-like phosphoesterase family protein